VYRGSIPIVVHLSNLLNCEMSIIKLEISNGDTTNKEKLKKEVDINEGALDELLSISKKLDVGMYSKRTSYKPNSTIVPKFLSNNFKETDNLIVIDDIYDTGKTIGLIQQLMKDEYSNHSVSYYSLFGNKNDVGVVYLREKNKLMGQVTRSGYVSVGVSSATSSTDALSCKIFFKTLNYFLHGFYPQPI
jgi:hypoxanthine phosphoribosyltransferase